MRRWEYRIIDTHQIDVPLSGGGSFNQRFQNGLCGLGVDGWMMCGCPSSNLLIFRREVPRLTRFLAWVDRVVRR